MEGLWRDYGGAAKQVWSKYEENREKEGEEFGIIKEVFLVHINYFQINICSQTKNDVNLLLNTNYTNSVYC